ncbi:alpha/beta hydrolase [Microbacterium sp. CnD16-F]|uniref:alpha/beta hydrolase n=1 Tax=Microbacterium sp. CnD16-F TaxID=2954493 RepID=UPI0020984C5A|nr:alpha/beta hydrolase [Microbacterium sp. CnD16-F]MCO7203809.1 alpha/beta hydrolase [Microbacterium sp. CnD16-F]
MSAAKRPRSRARRVVTIVALSLAGLLVAGVVGIVVWSQVGVMDAEADPLASVREDDRIVVADTGGNVVMSPASGESTVGLVFIPGAKVQAEAYEAKLSGLVAEDGMTVVITRPWLNLAFFDPRPLSDFTSAAPDVDAWLVGGHSLGGVRACQLGPDADGLVLFGSYCANDLSDSGLPVLSISGAEDGLSTPEKIQDARGMLPADAAFVEIAGAVHASFGDYGPQAGDGTPTIDDADMTAEITASVAELLPRL